MRSRIALAAVLSAFLLVADARAGIVDVGGTYNATGVNFPTNFGPTNLTLDLTTKPIGNGLQVREEVTDVGSPDTQWIEIIFSTIDGGPLAGNLNGFWRIDVNDIPLTTAVNFDGFFIYWAIDGVAVDPIRPFLGFTGTIPNPIDPARGDVYGAVFPPGVGPFTSFDGFTSVRPYSSISRGGMDPNVVNEFHIALRGTAIESTVVPEPSSLVLLAVGGCGLAGVGWRRRRKPA